MKINYAKKNLRLQKASRLKQQLKHATRFSIAFSNISGLGTFSNKIAKTS